MFDLIPFAHEKNNLFNYLDNMERNFFSGVFDDAFQFRCDIQDKGDHYLLEAELPGFQKEDIKLDLNNDTLTVSAQHNEEVSQKDNNGNYIRRERKFGSYSRSFDVSNVEAAGIEAAYNNGVLELKLPKKAPVVPASHRIEIK